MNTHKCTIGLLHHQDYSELCTLDDLVKHIEEQREFNKSLDDDPVFRKCEYLRVKVYTLKSYGDKRKKTDLTRFDYCPYCGKTIDWKSIKEKMRDD